MNRHILYISNYYLNDVIQQRNSKPFISQAGQNKSTYIIDMLKEGGNKVTVWSNAWTNSTSFKAYCGFQSKLNSDVYYADIIGIPFLNAWACQRSCKKFIKEFLKKEKIDAIVFYNMRMENAPVALWAKKKYGIPIILQYEDGLTQDANVGGIKKWIYEKIEKKTLPQLDGAFLVNSKISVDCPSVVIRGVIRDTDSKGEKKTTELEQKKHAPTILFASTLDKQRGIHCLLDALAYTKADFKLQLTGRGEGEKHIRECDDRRIAYLGFLDYVTYRQVLNEADICVNAQLAHHEFGNFSFPSKICEYLSERKLVVSSDVADAKEVLKDIAFVYEDDDPKKLAEAIERAIAVWKLEDERQQYQERIEAFVADNSIHKIAENVNQLLDEILRE